MHARSVGVVIFRWVLSRHFFLYLPPSISPKSPRVGLIVHRLPLLLVLSHPQNHPDYNQSWLYCSSCVVCYILLSSSLSLSPDLWLVWSWRRQTSEPLTGSCNVEVDRERAPPACRCVLETHRLRSRLLTRGFARLSLCLCIKLLVLPLLFKQLWAPGCCEK